MIGKSGHIARVVTREFVHPDEAPEIGGPNTPGDDCFILVDGTQIGGTYWCGADYIKDGERWASWGPAGLQMGYPTREAAEQIQVNTLNIAR